MCKRGFSLSLFLIAASGLYSCSHRQDTQTRAPQDADQAIARSISALAAQFNAVASWRQNFASKGSDGQIFTAELVPALVRSDGRPVLFIVDVQDVASLGTFQGQNLYECTFLAKANLAWNVKLMLGCNADQARQLMQNLSRYAVVAKIGLVRLSKHATEGDGDQEGENGLFVAHGVCLALVPVGKDYMEDDLDIISMEENKH
jgi:hypothetical protein